MDEDLISRAKNGDKEAFRALFDKYSGRILSYLYRYMGDYQKAEDVMIETFLDAYVRLSNYTEMGKFLPWLYAIATNFAKKEFRKRKKDKSFLEKSAGGNKPSIIENISDRTHKPDDAVMTQEFRQLIEKKIVEMDKKYRSVIILCDIQGMPYEEAAVALKCSKSAMGVRLIRARQLLFKALKAAGYDFHRGD